MPIDNQFTKLDGEWVFTNQPREEFWLNVCHSGRYVINERYYFPDLASALEFYVEGWKTRQFVEDGKVISFDHSGLYSRGPLINVHFRLR